VFRAKARQTDVADMFEKVMPREQALLRGERRYVEKRT